MTSVTEKGQVTIPKSIRNRAGIRPGDDLEFYIEDEEIKVRKTNSDNPFSNWKNKLETGKSADEIMEELRE